ncbi:MAG: hypothetical protein QW568_02635 [Candidatus Anstonellaceae archaeon]
MEQEIRKEGTNAIWNIGNERNGAVASSVGSLLLFVGQTKVLHCEKIHLMKCQKEGHRQVKVCGQALAAVELCKFHYDKKAHCRKIFREKQRDRVSL